MRLSKKIFILTIIPAIISALLIIFIIWPSLSSLQSLKIEIEKKNDEFKILKAQNVSQRLITAKLNNYLKNTEFVQKSIIKKENQLEFIKFLENLDQKYQIISQVDLNIPYSITKQDQNKDKPAEPKITPININISLIADFEQFLNYLLDLTQADYYININAIKASISSKEDLTVFSYKRTTSELPVDSAEPTANIAETPPVMQNPLFINLSAETYWTD